MARVITDLHPDLQTKITQLQKLCKQNGITIGIGECVRTVAEQDALYAQGRTKPGAIVTNAKGSSYSSMHQWGVAFDFYLIMDVDKDGKTSDDAFNNSTKLFNKVGALGKSIGLEWGGDWKSIVDLPHFQLPDWGSTATTLKGRYKTPEAFKKTWKTTTTTTTTTKAETDNKTTASTTKLIVEPAKSKDTKLSGTYTTTANLNLRTGAGTNKAIITTIQKGKQVINYGYYTMVGSTKWLFVQYGKKTGFVSAAYLKK